MHKIAFLIIGLLCCLGTAWAESNDDNEPAVGELSVEQLFSRYPSFKKQYIEYQPSAAELAASQTLQGKSILVLFGIWCHDSEREIPRLLKLIDVSQVKLASLSLQALNYSKQEPTGLHHTYDLKYTPTIVLLDGKRELGRIVEYPKVSLGEDFAKMIQEAE